MKSQLEIANEQLVRGEITTEEHQNLVAILSHSGISSDINSAQVDVAPLESNRQWFYEIDEQPIGPHSKNELLELIAKGVIKRTTLLWNDTMSDWLPLTDTELGTITTIDSTPNPAVVQLRTCTTCRKNSPDTSKFCIECGASMSNSHSLANTGQLPNTDSERLTWLNPSERTNVVTNYASYWSRIGASLIDTVIIYIFLFLFILALWFLFGEPSDEALGVLTQFSHVIYIIYYWSMESSSSQGTYGKKLLGLKVTDSNGNRISGGKSFGRILGKYISAITIIGFLMPLWTQRKQGLHDKMSDTLVLKVPK